MTAPARGEAKRAEAANLLAHYLHLARLNVPFSPDQAAEIRAIVDLIADAAILEARSAAAPDLKARRTR